MYTIDNLNYSYPNNTQALKNINLQINEGEVVLMCGPNGGGKSTLLKCMLGVIPEYTNGNLSGSVTFCNKPVSQYKVTDFAGKVGIVLQDPDNQVTNLSVYEEVAFGVSNLCLPVEEIYSRVEWALSKVHLKHLSNSSVFSLSGGQLQRLSITSILAMHPTVLLLDEPLAHLDPYGVRSVITTLNELREHIGTMVITTHWLDPFLDIATRVIIVSEGRIMDDFGISNLPSKTRVLKHNGIEIPHLYRLWDVLERKGIKARGKSIKELSTLEILPITSNIRKNPEVLLEGIRIEHQYPTGEKPFEPINFLIHKEARIGLVGHNGTGKTTLARIMSGLLKPSSGKVIPNFKKVGIVLQNPGFSFLTPNIVEEISYGNLIKKEEALKVLETCGLGKLAHHSPFELSGGQQKILALAIAQLSRAPFLVLDEPTAGLDDFYTRQLYTQLEKYTGTVLYISHDPRIIGNMVYEIMLMGKSTILFQGSIRDLTRDLAWYLGYPYVNPTVAVAIDTLSYGLPLIPEELEVKSEPII